MPCPNPIEFDQHFQLPPTGYDAKTHQINEALEQLNPVSATAYSKNLGHNQSNLQYCIYTIPKNPKLTAIAYYIKNIKTGNNDLLQQPKVKQLLQSLQTSLLF